MSQQDIYATSPGYEAGFTGSRWYPDVQQRLMPEEYAQLKQAQTIPGVIVSSIQKTPTGYSYEWESPEAYKSYYGSLPNVQGEIGSVDESGWMLQVNPYTGFPERVYVGGTPLVG